jgi:hypothetical protein
MRRRVPFVTVGATPPRKETTMGLLDKAKGLLEDHKDQIQQGIEKAKATVNKAGDSVNRAASNRLPNTGTVTPVAQPDEEVTEASAEGDTEASAEAGTEESQPPEGYRDPDA